MKAKELLSPLLGEKKGIKDIPNGLENAAKIIAVGFLALFAFGFFTTSQRVNAGQ